MPPSRLLIKLCSEKFSLLTVRLFNSVFDLSTLSNSDRLMAKVLSKAEQKPGLYSQMTW